MEERNVIRQGDILFIPIDKMPDWDSSERVQSGIIAEGTATGHRHRVEVLDAAEVFEGYMNKFVKVGPNGVSIVHEEHHTVTLAPNTTYRVHQAREYDYLAEATRYVAD